MICYAYVYLENCITHNDTANFLLQSCLRLPLCVYEYSLPMALQPDRLKQRRRALRLSQEQLAELTGVNQPQVSRWELGENDITGETLAALARALGTTSDWLLGLSDNPFQVIPSETSLDAQEADLITFFRRVQPAQRRIVLVLAQELSDIS